MTSILSVLTILSQILSVLVLLMIIFRTKSIVFQKMGAFLKKHAMWMAFFVALIAMLGSLFYSDILKYEPCVLCWYQRVVMYPNVILLGMALLRKSRDIIPYSAVLSGIGALIAGFHYYLQVRPIQAAFCDAIGYSVSCTESFFLNFGYVTIAMMAFSAFILIFLLLVVQRKSFTLTSEN